MVGIQLKNEKASIVDFPENSNFLCEYKTEKLLPDKLSPILALNVDSIEFGTNGWGMILLLALILSSLRYVFRVAEIKGVIRKRQCISLLLRMFRCFT